MRVSTTERLVVWAVTQWPWSACIDACSHRSPARLITATNADNQTCSKTVECGQLFLSLPPPQTPLAIIVSCWYISLLWFSLVSITRINDASPSLRNSKKVAESGSRRRLLVNARSTADVSRWIARFVNDCATAINCWMNRTSETVDHQQLN